MLQRNVRVKSAPQRWHLEGYVISAYLCCPTFFSPPHLEWPSQVVLMWLLHLKIVYTTPSSMVMEHFERIQFCGRTDLSYSDFMQRGSRKFNTVRVINIATKDTHSAAEVAGKQTHFLCSKVRWFVLLVLLCNVCWSSSEHVLKIDKLPPDMWEERFEEAIQSFEKQFKKRIVYSLQFY